MDNMIKKEKKKKGYFLKRQDASVNGSEKSNRNVKDNKR